MSIKKLERIRNIIVTIVLIALIVACAVIITMWRQHAQYKKQLEAMQHLIDTQEPQVIIQEKETIVEKEAVITGATIQAGIREIGKLVTAEYYFTHVESHASNLQIVGIDLPLTQSSFIYSYDGSVLAGIDFSKITVNKDDESRVIMVTLPKPETISAAVDPDSFKLYDEKNNIFNPIKVTDVANSFADLIHSEEQKAIDGGLYGRAKDNAILMIENFLLATYPIHDYQIVVQGKLF